jgi:hypothetical protein
MKNEKDVKILKNLDADELRAFVLDVLRQNAQLKELSKEQSTSSVEIKNNSKGTNISIKTYSNDIEGTEKAYNEAVKIYRKALKEKDLKLQGE